MSSDQAPVDQTDAGVTVKPRRVRCLTTTEETVYWGDDGVNIKAMDLKSGTGINIMPRAVRQIVLIKRKLTSQNAAKRELRTMDWQRLVVTASNGLFSVST